MTRKFTSSFVDVGGNVWRAEIKQSNATTSAVVSGFSFDLDAAEIEWPERELWEPLMGSACTLRVVSPGDRTFIELYSTEPGDVVLRLYCNNELRWQGVLDPEFYEEPYDSASDYEVTLTFSDLGALERAAFDGNAANSGSLATILKKAFESIGLDFELAEAFSLTSPTGSAVSLADISVRYANFYDEDGKGLAWSEVVAGVLQPLGLRMVQLPGGVMKVFDLYGQRALTPEQIRWEGTGHTLGTGKVYNDISVTYAPYGDSTPLNCTVDADKLSTLPGYTLETIYHKTNDSSTYESFALKYRMGYSGTTPVILDHDKACFYRMRRILSGDDSEGIAGKLCNPSGPQTTMFGGVPWWKYYQTYRSALFEAGSFVLNGASGGSSDSMFNIGGGDYLCVKLEMLLDSRVNPFEKAEAANEQGDYKRQEKQWHLVYIPVIISFDADDGTQWYWSNGLVRMSYEPLKKGKWTQGQAEWGSCWLAYYNWNDRKEKSPCNGWMKNKQCIGYYNDVPDWWEKRGDGEFIPVPDRPGVLKVIVGADVDVWSYSDNFQPVINNGMWETPRWLLYKSLTVELTDGYGRAYEAKDSVLTASISATARSPLNIDTICGSGEGVAPTSRGVLMYGGAPLQQLTRGALTDTPERLLIAALASQYDRRHTSLSGECSVAATDLSAVFVDAAQPAGRRFAPVSCVYRVREDVAECRFIELSEQKYTPVK